MENERLRKIAKKLGDAIARKRAERGLTQEEVAERLGVGNEAISRIERGVVLPTLARLFDFADALGCRIDELLYQASDRAVDQGAAIAQHLARLSERDRLMVTAAMSTLVDRLAEQGERKGRTGR